MSRTDSGSIHGAVEAFARGEPALVHDAADREGETDLMYPAHAISPAAVSRLRNDAGGLICVAVSDAIARVFELPFLQTVIDHPTTQEHELAYDTRSSFSLSVNHRSTRTGVTDRDRAHTIAELGRAAANPHAYPFVDAFRSPGHVHVLRAAPGLLSDRQGHTELGVTLAHAANLPPAVVLCEMLDDETGDALSPEKAEAYADRLGAPYLEGAELTAEVAETVPLSDGGS